jgi:hypothetical protein
MELDKSDENSIELGWADDYRMERDSTKEKAWSRTGLMRTGWS